MSNELKKGDLVRHRNLDKFLTLEVDYRIGESHVHCKSLQDGVAVSLPAPMVVKYNRQDVEQHIKGMGWEWDENLTTDENGEPLDCSSFKKGNHYVWYDSDKVWYVSTHAIRPKDFDTATQQLAEATLVARLLNANNESK